VATKEISDFADRPTPAADDQVLIQTSAGVTNRVDLSNLVTRQGSITLTPDGMATPSNQTASQVEWQGTDGQREDAFEFRQGNDQSVQANIPVPDDWDSGGFTVVALWGSSNAIPGGTVENVRWDLEDKVLDASIAGGAQGGTHAVAWAARANVTVDIGNAAGDFHRNRHFATTIGTTAVPTDRNSFIGVQVTRLSNTTPPANEYNDDVYLIALKLLYTRRP
jgi:hypothetical protein